MTAPAHRISRSPRRYALAAACALALIAPLVAAAEGGDGPQVDAARAAAVKAAYLRHIAQFTRWPEGALGQAQEPMVIGVVGDDASGVIARIARAIDEKGLRAQGRPLAVRRIADLPRDPEQPADPALQQALAGLHLLFLTADAGWQWERVHRSLAHAPVMTVSEVPGFARERGMIELVINPERGRIDMHIDLDAVGRARLQLSSKLLGLKDGVRIVRTAGPAAACADADCSAGRPRAPSTPDAQRDAHAGIPHAPPAHTP